MKWKAGRNFEQSHGITQNWNVKIQWKSQWC